MQKMLFAVITLWLQCGISYAQSCENFYTPEQCKTQPGCDYDFGSDVCKAAEPGCAFGYVSSGNSCTRVSCGVHDGQERFYLDEWRVVLERASPCYMGRGSNSKCTGSGSVSNDYFPIYPPAGSAACSIMN